MSRGPATPIFVLRGHNASVHSLLFFSDNGYLASGDSEGWLVIWSTSTKRTVAAWKAHQGGITGVKIWREERLISHGRDHKLRVWQLRLKQDTGLPVKLPADGGVVSDNPAPWLLHSLDISALNFCTFATCQESARADKPGESLLIGTANGLDPGGVDIFQLPSEHRISQLHSDKKDNTGMVMAIGLFQRCESINSYLVSGYEDGRVAIYVHQGELEPHNDRWQRLMICKAHSQPVLSVTIGPSRDYFFTSSADATIAKFALPDVSSSEVSTEPLKSINTKHAGQQGLSIRSDGKIFATAGWDARVRVYSMKTLKELAVLKWHKDGCYTTTFAEIGDEVNSIGKEIDHNDGTNALLKSPLDLIRRERSMKAQRTHWLAVGGKDGKVSLWDLY